MGVPYAHVVAARSPTAPLLLLARNRFTHCGLTGAAAAANSTSRPSSVVRRRAAALALARARFPASGRARSYDAIVASGLSIMAIFFCVTRFVAEIRTIRYSLHTVHMAFVFYFYISYISLLCVRDIFDKFRSRRRTSKSGIVSSWQATSCCRQTFLSPKR